MNFKPLATAALIGTIAISAVGCAGKDTSDRTNQRQVEFFGQVAGHVDCDRKEFKGSAEDGYWMSFTDMESMARKKAKEENIPTAGALMAVGMIQNLANQACQRPAYLDEMSEKDASAGHDATAAYWANNS